MSAVSRLADAVRNRSGTGGFDRRLIAPLVLGAVLNPVNSSILAVSLVPIGRDLDAPPSQTAWLVSGLYLATAVGQPVVGRLVDLHGPRRLYLVGTALVGVAGVLGMLAPSLPWLVVARVLLGFGTCAGYPAAMNLVRSEAERTGEESPVGVLTLLTVSSQTVAVVGPTVGGLLIGLGGWRATLAVNVPLAVACLVLGARRLPRHRPPAADEPRDRLDVPGISLFAGGLVALLLFVMEPSVRFLWLVGIAVVLGAAFVAVERRAPAPFVDLRLLRRSPSLVATYARMVLAATTTYAVLYGFTQWLQDDRALTATQAGLVLLPMSVGAIAVSVVTGRSPRVAGKLVVGAVCGTVGAGLLLLVGPTTPVVLVCLVMLVVGVPQGVSNLANQTALYHQAPADRIASSAGLLRTAMYLGAIVAAAATGLFLGDAADTDGLHDLALVCVVGGALLLVLSVADRGLRRVGR